VPDAAIAPGRRDPHSRAHRDPEVCIADIARTIENDQGLTAKILRTVNSSYYGLRKPCPTIQQAVVILGLSAVKSLALGFSLVTSVKGIETDCIGLHQVLAPRPLHRHLRQGHRPRCASQVRG
jgi:hypothetical protein